MKNNQNIEDIFRQGMDDYKLSPSDKVWSGINKKLVGPRFDALYRNAFKGFKVAPSEQIWRRVAAAVWFNKFIHFTPFSFNIYYLGFIMTAVVGTVITVNNNPNLEFFHFDQKSTEQVISKEDEEIAEIPVTNDLLDNDSEAVDLTEKETVVSSDSKKEVDKNVNNSNISLLQVTNVVTPDIFDTNSVQNAGETDFSDNNTNGESVAVISTTAISVFSNDLITNDSQLELSGNDNSQKFNITLSKLLQIKKLNLSYSPDWEQYAELVFSSAPKRDEIVYDTIGYNYLGEPVIVEKSWFAIDLSFSPHITNNSYELLNQELQSNYNFYSANNKPGFSYSAGLGLSFNYNRFNIESGVYYHKLNQSISQTVKVYDYDTSSYFDYFENEKWKYDTTLILDLDEYLNGNTVYIPYVDSSLVYYTDSLEVFISDSVLVDKLLSAANSYRVIDVPIIAGYEMRFNKFTITPKAGLITGFATKRTGTFYNISDGKIINADLVPSNKIIFDYYAAVNLKYNLNKHFSLYVEPHLRGNLNSLYPSSFIISEKNRKFGIKTGISYKF